MASRPPAPPPREPRFEPPDDHSTAWTILKVLAYVVGGFVLLVVAGLGLVIASCGL